MKTIYFVHDQEESPAARQNFLEMAGFDVKLMTSGRELFVALQERHPDLVLMDVLIEGRHGFEVCRDLDSRYLRRKFPIVLTSRIYTSQVFRDEALRSGAQDYLIRSMPLDELLERLHTVLESWTGSGDAQAA